MKAEHSIIDAARYLNMARVALASAVWRDHQCTDEELGRHLDALNVHIDNAIGRGATVQARLRVVDRAYAARLSDSKPCEKPSPDWQEGFDEVDPLPGGF